MDSDDKSKVSSSFAEASPPASDDEMVVSAMEITSLQPAQPLIAPPIILTPGFPPIAPIPVVSTPIPRPLAPLPPRPPSIRPSLGQNGDSKTSDSDSDQDESGYTRSATASNLEYEISEESRQVRERQEKVMQELWMKRHAAAMAVPTNDGAVRTRLRRLGEPITLFGEREMERRDRLRALMAKLDSEGQLEMLMKAHEDEEAAAMMAPARPEEDIQYPFYTEGSQALLEARKEIAKFSIVKAALRLHRARKKRDDPDEDLDAEVDWSLKQAEKLVLDSSEIGDDRPLSGCSISHDGKMLATCSLSGVAKLWSMPEVRKVSALKGHSERATDVAFSPINYQLASASADRTARL